MHSAAPESKPVFVLIGRSRCFRMLLCATILVGCGQKSQSTPAEPAAPPTPATPAPTTPQRVEVTTVTTGVNLDPTGYGILNDEWDYDVGDGVTVAAPTNGLVVLSLRPGGHVLSVVDVAPNCTGESINDRPVTVQPGVAVTSVVFQLVCK